jgi:hypothetical protein
LKTTFPSLWDKQRSEQDVEELVEESLEAARCSAMVVVEDLVGKSEGDE